MRLVLLAQAAVAAFLLAGCPGTEETDPTGGSAGSNSTGSAGTNSGGGGSGTQTATGTGGNGMSGSGAGNGSGGAGAGSGSGGAGAGSGSGGAGAGAGNGGSGQGGAGNGSATSSSTGAGGGSTAVCQQLEEKYQVNMVEAQKCYPKVDIPQCVQSENGPCCDINVAFAGSPEVQAYLDALAAYQNEGCMAVCPPTPCPPMPTWQCKPDFAGADTGKCVVMP